MFRKIPAFLKDVRLELGKVSWSSRSELANSTWVVLATTALLGAVIGIFDVICTVTMHAVLR